MKREQSGQRFSGENHQGAEHSTPYPVSRMAPATELVDLAAQIDEADRMLTCVTEAKLKQIAEQIRGLRRQAATILQTTLRDQQLHRARCNFQRRPGGVYHLYRRANGEEYLSMLAPAEWGAAPPHSFVGTFRLENDMSWVQLDTERPEEEL